MSLIAELKRRNVFRLGIVVLAIALAYFAWDKIAPAQDTIVASSADSNSAPGIAPIFPDSVQLAPGGPSETSDLPEPGGINRVPDEQEGTAPSQKSIAILPFTNRSTGQENARFLSDGIHGDLLTKLSKIHELKVISRTSVMAYRDTTKNMRQIGDELGVANLLEGGVQQSGERVRINVQLINARNDQHVWEETYDRDVSAENIFDIQGEIARAIASALEATLSPEENEKLSRTPTENFEAYQAQLMSRQLTRRGGFNALPSAIEYARKAIELDPAYPDAHLALAFALTQSINHGAHSDKQAGAEISKAIDTALALRPDYGEAWSILGHYQSSSGKSGADQSLEKAMRLNPGNAQTMYAYAQILQASGRPQQALPLILQASELDPFSPTVLFALGRNLDALEKFDEARESFARIREIDPVSPLGFTPVSGTYYAQGKIDQSLYWLSQGQVVDPKDFELAGWMMFLNDCLEDYAAASEWSGWLESWVTNQPQPMAMQARHHYLMGDFNTALQYSNLALRLGLPDRWGSDAIFMRIKRDEALGNGDPEAGIDAFRSQHPKLFTAPPDITADNLLQAVDLALLLKLSGRREETLQLLQTAIEFYDQPWAVTGSVRATLVSAKAEALAIMDSEPAALAELRRIVDKGWRMNWRWKTELNFNFNGIREKPEFRAMLDELQADMAVQRANAQAMAARGEIKRIN